MLDEALNLPPAAIMDDIAQFAAATGASRGLVGGEIAEPLHQFGRVARGGGIGNVDVSLQVGFPRLAGVTTVYPRGACESAHVNL